ncbi:D-alanine--D-alanine ligase [Candidatus Rickettsiella viridis]|uniref:D-alanine--D-alanine ligase n=1 Tax=Candidatus Rickettsiella viridis TaxID=676208 RepID=A0A2Z5UV27_9COXI|nr:D-alanine--D-alanine ligase family protein [Candidatus Rickettsiella viridis]BBB15334.1 D-alanine--D-alanine ligase [Candidatus Rickettsiella viridis]
MIKQAFYFMVLPVKKIKVAVLYGGRSAEHEVSLQSAAAVIKNLDKNKFEVIPVSIDKQGHWLVNDLKQFPLDESAPVKTSVSKELFVPEAIINQTESFFDVVFPVLHGSFGEDGTMQGLLEILGLPYVGANVLGSAIGMDKVIAKRLAQADKIPVVPFVTFNTGEWKISQTALQKRIEKELDYPLFVKPVNAGSSLGITKVKKAADLLAAVNLAAEFDTKILVEQALVVREIEVAVLENLSFGEQPLVSVLGEINPQHEFYSYEAKYLDDKGAELIIPAVLQERQSEKIKKLAAKVFSSLACQGMARVDFFIEEATQNVYLNEINTIPGFTKISMYPKLWEASGLSYQQLLTHLIELALARHARLSHLKQSQSL